MASKRRRLDILAKKKDDILKWVSENLPNAEIARRLNCKVDTLKSYYKIFGISYKGNQNRANMKHHESRKPPSRNFEWKFFKLNKKITFDF